MNVFLPLICTSKDGQVIPSNSQLTMRKNETRKQNKDSVKLFVKENYHVDGNDLHVSLIKLSMLIMELKCMY